MRHLVSAFLILVPALSVGTMDLPDTISIVQRPEAKDLQPGSIVFLRIGGNVKELLVTPSNKSVPYSIVQSKDDSFHLTTQAPLDKSGLVLVIALTDSKGKLYQVEQQVTATAPKPPPPVPDDDPPDDDPKPPGPDVQPPLIGDGFRVLIIYESADLSKMPVTQMDVIYSKEVRDYLNSKCVTGPDGKTKEWRIYDKDTSLSGGEERWAAGLSRAEVKTPWILIANGKTGYSGPLPGNVADTLALLRKWGN